jgi:hypothetical protein
MAIIEPTLISLTTSPICSQTYNIMNQSNNHLDDLQLDMNTRNDQHHSTSEPASEEWSVSPKEDNSQKKGYFSILKETVAHPNMQALRAPKIDVSIRKDQLDKGAHPSRVL